MPYNHHPLGTTSDATTASTAITPPTNLATIVTTKAAPVDLYHRALPSSPAIRDPTTFAAKCTGSNDAGPSNEDWFNKGYVSHSLPSLDPYHVSPDFIGGRIRHDWKAWRLISADLWILGVVREGFRLEFEFPPVAWIVPRNVGMSEVQSAIGRQEVNDLLKKRTIVEPGRIDC